MTKATIKKGLGKGLGALFTDIDSNEISINPTLDFDTPKSSPDRDSVVEIKIIDIEPNREQPRKNFDPEKLESLTESIKTHGVIQPILVKPTVNGTYQIVAGERRWRAAKNANIKTMPCIVKDYSERDIMEIALIENLQREDLNPIEEAEGYKKLMLTFNLTQEDISERVGKSRPAIANSLRLNNLPDEIKQFLISDKLSTGHARALLAIDDPAVQLETANKIINEALTVRQTESLISEMTKKQKPKPKIKLDKASARYFNELEKSLADRFSTKVKIYPGKTKSKIEFEYYTLEDLERMLEMFHVKG